MRIIHCAQCGGKTPEGFSLCPDCMSRTGAGEAEVAAAMEILEIASIINMGDTDASRRAAIESIMKIKNRLEEADHAEKEKEQAPKP